MPIFRRVDASQAGPNALGILVPPGEPTLVIVRPRPLSWDLLPARWDGSSDIPPSFCQFGREEAARVARRLQSILEECVVDGRNPIETFGDAQGRHFQVWLRTTEFFWILCSRVPGQAYKPAIFSARAEAEQAAQQLVPLVWPNAEQMLYFNTQLFAN